MTIDSRTGLTVRLGPVLLGWYPQLADKWGGDLKVVGPYAAGNPDEVVVRNVAGDTMAVRWVELALP
jgi:hypothetical protein